MPASPPVSTTPLFERLVRAQSEGEAARYLQFCRTREAERLAARRRALRHRAMLAPAIVALRLAGLARWPRQMFWPSSSSPSSYC